MNIPFPPRKYLALLCAAFLPAFFAPSALGQSYFNMSSGDYSNSFTGWTTYATNWNGLPTNATGTIPSATRITAASINIIAPSSSGGVQSTNTSTNLQFLSTGSTANSSSTGADLNLNFSGRNAGTISFAAAQVANSSGDRIGTLQLYYSTNGTTWTEITGTSLPFTATNNVARSANISVNLPAALNDQSTVKLRFYYYNGPTAGNTGSRPKISIDDLLVTSTALSGTPPVITTFDPTSGAAGTAVTIGGSNFTGATNVAFNGVVATFSNVTDTSISATVPAGALSGPISVSTPAGLATSTNSFLVPTVSVVLPATINEGTSGFGEARINVEPTNDIEVVLTSSSTNDLTVETPITIFAGTTNYTFSITAPSDSVIDPNTNVTVTPSAAGYAAAPGTISVVNVDAVKIPLTTFASNSYTQNFDSLGTTTISNVISLTTGQQTGLGSAVSTNLNGWYAAKIAGSGGIANIVADNGSGTSGAIYNYGSTNSPANTNRSLGTLASGSFTGAFGALVVNNTGDTINSVIINLTGKFWRTSTTLQNSLTFGYGKIEGATLNNNNFLSVSNGVSILPGANVVGPAPVNPAIALDGNDPANQIAISNVAIPVQLLPGETMFFRWQDVDGGGSDAGLAIDNLSLTASTNAPLPVVGSVSIDQFSLNQIAATASSSVVSDGGASLTSRGFVYALTSVSSNPVIGGSNVVVVTNDPPEVSAFTNTFTGLSADVSYSVRSFVVNGAGTNYSSAVQFSTLPVPPSFTGAYTQNFNGFTNMDALPLGWRALSTSNINTYAGDWNATNSVSAGFYGRTNIPGVLGYLHTSSTGILSNTLTLVNDTGGTLTNLFVSYVGEVNVLGTNNTRFPSWTVVVDGQTNAALAYSTASGSNEFKSAEITGLNISNGGNIVISWWSDRGTNTGSSRMIGMTDVRVATNAASGPTISVSGTLTNFATTLGTASASQSFNASGTDLISDLTVTAPTNYQVSLDNSSFGSSVALPQTNGMVASSPIYVRIAATAPIGSPAGSVTLASSGASSQNVLVTGTVSQAGETFANWAQGAPLNSTNLLIYSIGGASSPTAADGVAPVTGITATDLTLTAIVRTNDPSLTTEGTALIDLVGGTWSSNGVTMTVDGNQDEVPEGCERQIFSTPRGVDGKKFLRLQSTLGQP